MSTSPRESAPPGFDVIGDVHGHAEKLEGLLAILGYETDKGWRHPEGRQVIFVGDLIDIGPTQLRTLYIARAMVESGHAQMVMGNHEYNAIAWATPDPDRKGEFLRPHFGDWGPKNRLQHSAFLEQVGEDSATHARYIEWFKTLPLWLDLGELRIVHACWSEESMDVLSPYFEADCPVTDEFMAQSSRDGTEVFRALENVLKGPDIKLPHGFAFMDHYGIERDRARRRWWNAEATTLRRATVIPSDARSRDGSVFPRLPDTPLDDADNHPYTDSVPVVFGHYWRSDTREDTATTVCVDHSAGKRGPLMAYRWNERDESLTRDNMRGFPAAPAVRVGWPG